MYQEQTTITVFETSWQTGAKCQICVFALYNMFPTKQKASQEANPVLPERKGSLQHCEHQISAPQTLAY